MQTDSLSEIYEELWRIIKDLCQVIVHTDFAISKNQNHKQLHCWNRILQLQVFITKEGFTHIVITDTHV